MVGEIDDGASGVGLASFSGGSANSAPAATTMPSTVQTLFGHFTLNSFAWDPVGVA
jgi:hypothetical protein